MLLWIKNALTPQEIRDHIMNPTSEFQKSIVEYLESVHKGEFTTGTMAEVEEHVSKIRSDPDHVLLTLTMPDKAEIPCTKHTKFTQDCKHCQVYRDWHSKYSAETDELLYLLNRHSHNYGCKNNKYKSCKAHFPRQTFTQTSVDPETGALNMKKGEAFLNTFTPVITYLMRCNTDVTSLLSGTAIKSVIAYVTDYITKSPLKTHTMFDAIQKVFDRNTEMINSDNINRKQKA